MHLAPALPVVAEEDCEAGDRLPYLIVVEVGAGPWAKGRDALRLQGGEVRTSYLLTHAMEEQRYLAIVGNGLALLREPPASPKRSASSRSWLPQIEKMAG